MATIRKTIINEIITELKNIEIANGFSYDQDDDYVYDWLDVKQLGDTTVLEVRDPSSDSDDEGGYNHNELTVEIAIIEAGDTVTTSIRDKMNDILLAMKNFKSNGSASRVIYLGDETDFDREQKKIGESFLRFVIEYRSDLFTI